MVKSNACKGSWEGWKADFLWCNLIFFFSEATSPPAEGFILEEKQLCLFYEDDKGRYIWKQGKTERAKCFGWHSFALSRQTKLKQ